MNSIAKSLRTPRKSQIAHLRHGFGFSLIELLVVVALASAVITAGVLMFQTLVSSDSLRFSSGNVNVGAALTNFYGGSLTTTNALYAPSYGQAAQAEIVRDKFIGDLQQASAVFCLGRNGLNTIRPITIPVDSTLQGRNLDTPEAFRLLLASSLPESAGIFSAYRGASTATNASIFILKPSSYATELSVLAVYDIDLTPTTSPAGTYASVKRYEGGVYTDSYDVFYPSSSGTLPFNPLVVAFERSVRSVTVESATIDSLKKAAERPFYFIWWPDPAAHTLEALSAPSFSTTDPRYAYSSMGGRTSFFFVVPMFPPL